MLDDEKPRRLAVNTADLAAVLRSKIDQGEAIADIAARADMPERKLRSILRVEYGTTNVEMADRLLVEIGEETALLDGRVQMRPDGRSRRANSD